MTSVVVTTRRWARRLGAHRAQRTQSVQRIPDSNYYSQRHDPGQRSLKRFQQSQSLTNYGAYLGYQRVWIPDRSQSNIGAGYAFADATAAMPANAARNLTNAWMNQQWRVSAGISMGVEYQYVIRDVQSGLEGDNHRVTFSTQFLK